MCIFCKNYPIFSLLLFLYFYENTLLLTTPKPKEVHHAHYISGVATFSCKELKIISNIVISGRFQINGFWEKEGV